MTVSTHQPAPLRTLLRTVPLAAALMLAACGGGSGDAAPGATSLAASVTAVDGATGTETALTPVAASASASERGDLSAAAAIDRNQGTRWSSGASDDQTLTLDFGSVQTITR
ncbi:MAG TPA: discoidin domain-containing protein, partial [Telluria sp.]